MLFIVSSGYDFFIVVTYREERGDREVKGGNPRFDLHSIWFVFESRRWCSTSRPDLMLVTTPFSWDLISSRTRSSSSTASLKTSGKPSLAFFDLRLFCFSSFFCRIGVNFGWPNSQFRWFNRIPSLLPLLIV